VKLQSGTGITKWDNYHSGWAVTNPQQQISSAKYEVLEKSQKLYYSYPSVNFGDKSKWERF